GGGGWLEESIHFHSLFFWVIPHPPCSHLPKGYVGADEMMFVGMERRSGIDFDSRQKLIDEEERMSRPGYSSGTTANVVLIEAERLVIANAGDCRAVLCRGGRAID